MAEKEGDELTLLARLMAERGVTADWLAGRSREISPEFPVSKSTVGNWRRGVSQVAQDWRSVAVIARLLDLDLEEADKLFESLGCLTIQQRQQLRGNGEFDEEGFLNRWTVGSHEATVERLPPKVGPAEQACRFILGEAAVAERQGNREVASTLYDRCFLASREAGLVDLAVEAALGGVGFSGVIGGQADRLRRLQVLAGELEGQDKPARYGEVVVELAYEVFLAQLPWDDRLDRALLVEAEGSGESAVLARRMLLVLGENTRRVAIDEALVVVTDAASLDSSIRSKCLATAIHTASGEGAWNLAAQWINELEDLGRRSGVPRARWQALTSQASLFDARGLSDEADDVASQALDIGKRLFNQDDAEAAYGLLHIGRAFRNDTLDDWREAIDEVAASRYRYPILFALRGLATVKSDRDVAFGLLEQASRQRPHTIDPFRAGSLSLTVALAYRLGQIDTAQAAADELKSWSGRLLFPFYGGPFLGPVDWFLALAAKQRNDLADQDRLMDRSDRLAQTSGAETWFHASVRTSWLQP